MRLSPDMSAAANAAVDAPEAIRRVGAGEAWLLDVREDDEWQAGHAGAAHHIPMYEIAGRQDELPDHLPILVICHLGQRSRFVTDALRRAGYAAANIEGGMDAWLAADGDVTR